MRLFIFKSPHNSNTSLCVGKPIQKNFFTGRLTSIWALMRRGRDKVAEVIQSWGDSTSICIMSLSAAEADACRTSRVSLTFWLVQDKQCELCLMRLFEPFSSPYFEQIAYLVFEFILWLSYLIRFCFYIASIHYMFYFLLPVPLQIVRSLSNEQFTFIMIVIGCAAHRYRVWQFGYDKLLC